MDPHTISGTKQAQVRVKLTSRLVTSESMILALKELQPKLIRYTVILRRSLFNAEAVENDELNLVIFDEPLVLGNEIDKRILRSKSALLVASVKDGGTAVINLTARRIEPLFSSSDLKEAVDSFNARLIEGARSRWLTGGVIASLVFLPLAAIIGVVVADGEINPQAEKTINGVTQLHLDHWVGQANLKIAILWIFTIIGAIILGALRTWAGPLGIWPEKMTTKSLVLTLYRLRVSNGTRRNVTTVLLSVAAGLIIVFLTRLL